MTKSTVLSRGALYERAKKNFMAPERVLALQKNIHGEEQTISLQS